MATAGSGDVLAGLTAGLAAQHMAPFEAACLGAYLHGEAGDRAVQTTGYYGLMASDLCQAIHLDRPSV
jgi:NAD(P)H-hydrate epimerase